MSRAIPSSFNEYLLDNTTQNTGIICDGGIMPLRTNPDPTSTWYKYCLRGEDIMFLKEAIASRRNTSSNDGLDDTTFKPSRLTTLQTHTGWIFDGGNWTDTDPRSAIGFHSFGSGTSNPTWQQITEYVLSCFHPIQQASKYDTYTTLDHVPIENLFKDVKSLSYTWLNGNNIYYHYDGYSSNVTYTYRYYNLQNSSSGGSPRIVDEVRNDNNWCMWQSYNREVHRPNYPSGLDCLYTYTPLTCTTTFTEDSWDIYRRRHRYLEVSPFGVFAVRNIYMAYSNSVNDSFETQYWVLAPFPEEVFYDTLTATTITLTNQTAWDNWVTTMFNLVGLKKNAIDIGSDRPKPPEASYEIQQNAILNTPHYTFWIAHQKYCSLDNVTI